MEQERVWIEGARAGDHRAFAQLVETYKQPIYNLAYRMLGNPADAEDAAQETFLRVYRQLSTFDPSRKFASWILAIAAHYCIDQLRRRRFTTTSWEDVPPGQLSSTATVDPEDAALRSEAQDQAQRLLSCLEPSYRLAVVLRYWYDMSYQEIAETMGISESAVKSRLHRARLRMAEMARKLLADGELPQNPEADCRGSNCTEEALNIAV